MLSFLHSADWQIGKPYARVKDPDKRARLRQVRLEAIAGIGRHAQDRQAAFLVVAGDLFDSPTPSGSDVFCFRLCCFSVWTGTTGEYGTRARAVTRKRGPRTAPPLTTHLKARGGDGGVDSFGSCKHTSHLLLAF